MGPFTPLLGFQATPIKQYLQLDSAQAERSASSPPEDASLPERAASAQQSATGYKKGKSTHKKRRTGQKKTVNLTISDLQ